MNTIYHMPMPRSFAEVEAWMAGKDAKKIAHNTYISRLELTGGLNVTYHGHSIITYYPDSILVAHRGWPTSTTTARFQKLTPFMAYRKFTYEKDSEGRKAWRAGVEEQAIFVAGIKLPDDGSSLVLDWDGQPV